MPLTAALQLHSVREAMRFDPFRALEEVAKAGYRNVEFSAHDALDPLNCYGANIFELGARCSALSLRVIGGQVRNLNEVNIDAVLDIYRELGSAHLTLPIDYFPTASAIASKASLYNALGTSAARSGLKFYYAHHYHEFQRADGETVVDQLLRHIDPALVNLAFSPYWLMRGLVEPVGAFLRYQSRIGIVELADFPLEQVKKLDMWSFRDHHPIAKNIAFDSLLKGGEIENIHPVQCALFTEIGEGIVKLQEIIDAANTSGRVGYAVLRQDFTRLPTEFASVQRSLQNCGRLRGLNLD